MNAVIETRGLSKRYGAKRAVDGLDFVVPAGSVFGFLGPNGAGKTTTFSLLCGFVRPSGGEATVLGEPLTRLGKLRGRMAALPQDARFHPSRSLMDSLVLFGGLAGMSRGEARAEARRVLDAVELGDAARVKGRALSHGMAKRFGIAQAFMGRPDLVLLDEPTEGLDPRTAHTVRQLIRSLAGQATVLVSSHNLGEVEDICDEAAIIDHGKLVTQGSLTELTATDEQIVITTGACPDAARAALARLESVREVTPEGDAHLRVRLRAGGGAVEPAITAALACLIEHGATISAVTRGKGLEARFLEETR